MKFKVQPSVESLVNTHSGATELKFHVAMMIDNKQYNPLVSIYTSKKKKLDPARLGTDVINFVFELDKYYNDIIRMCNEWCQKFVEMEGGPKYAPLDHTDPIDATKDFELKQIWISQDETQAVATYLNDGKKYTYDTVIWFKNYNDSGRGFDARFYKGKLVNVEMAS